jgi:hypothetical protein
MVERQKYAKESEATRASHNGVDTYAALLRFTGFVFQRTGISGQIHQRRAARTGDRIKRPAPDTKENVS